MSDKAGVTLMIDGREIRAREGQTILEAAQDNGIYIPRLCWLEGLTPAGACRVCTVRANGRAQAACVQPVAEGMFVENETEDLQRMRRDVIDMLFVEGNHFCMFCEKSGNCELQALAYRFGITAPRFPYMFPRRELDASHPEVMIDRDRCVLCSRCVRASEEIDGKGAFGFVGRSHEKTVALDSGNGMRDADVTAADRAVQVCPTGSLMTKRVGFAVPVGQRKYDRTPIGSEIEGGAGGEE